MSAIDNLLQLMQDLRDPESGCPWDLRQTSKSIAPHTLDETHELLDAIERNDTENIQEELGDLLFNIVFHAQLAEEQGQFTFADVAQGITDKMRRRHPHVFGDQAAKRTSDAELAAQWQALKKQEKPTQEQLLIGSDSTSCGAIYRARLLQKQAAKLGFDWPTIDPVLAKLDEELNELKQAIDSCDENAIRDELGDLMFVCVNLARHAQVDAEMSLRQTNQKFLRRFEYVQQQMLAAGITMEQQQLAQMEHFWQESKAKVG